MMARTKAMPSIAYIGSRLHLREEWQLPQRQSERRTKISLPLKIVFSTEIKEISPCCRSLAS